jgi:hypothetical protein
MAFTNEKEFDEGLKNIGSLYEEGKDCLHCLSILEEEREDYDRVFEILREFRDIAAMQLKAAHKITDN